MRKNSKVALSLFSAFLCSLAQRVSSMETAALFEGQTDEQELGFTYAQLDHFLKGGPAEPEVIERIKYLHSSTAHKRAPIYTYSRKYYYKREERLGTKDML